MIILITYTLRNNKSPVFMTPIIIDYHFEVYQKLKINVYDNDDVIGSGECTLAELLTTSGQCFRTELKHKSKKTGVVYISADVLSENPTTDLWFL